MTKRYYSDDDEAYLREAYLSTPWPEIMAKLPGRTKNSIRRKAMMMGLCRRKTGRKPEAVFIEELRRRREGMGMTRAQLSEKMGYSESVLYRWETGLAYPKAVMLKDWCQALDVQLVLQPTTEEDMTDTRLVDAIKAATKGVEVLVDRHRLLPCVAHEVEAGGMHGFWGRGALYLSEEQAVAAYEQTLKGFLKDRKATRIRFDKGPVIERWHMTRADSAMTHRVADPRITVTSTIEIYDESVSERP